MELFYLSYRSTNCKTKAFYSVWVIINQYPSLRTSLYTVIYLSQLIAHAYRCPRLSAINNNGLYMHTPYPVTILWASRSPKAIPVSHIENFIEWITFVRFNKFPNSRRNVAGRPCVPVGAIGREQNSPASATWTNRWDCFYWVAITKDFHLIAVIERQVHNRRNVQYAVKSSASWSSVTP